MPSPAADLVVLGTIGKLYAHGHGLSGYCRPCRRYFRVPMPVLIAARGADSPVVGMRPLRCAACLGRETEIRVSLCTCCRQYPGVAAGCILRSTSPAVSAFPEMAVGSATHFPFRGLLRVHSRSRVRSSSATAPRLPDAGRQRQCRSGRTRDLPASDAVLLHVMWPWTPAGRQHLA